MDQLPDIQSDADVDALMARLRAKVAGTAAPGPPAVSSAERSGNALRDFLAVHEEYASAICHALQVVADTLDDLHDETDNTRASTSRRIGSTATRINSRRRKTR